MSTEQRDEIGRKCKDEEQDGINTKQHFRENIKIPGSIIYTVSYDFIIEVLIVCHCTLN